MRTQRGIGLVEMMVAIAIGLVLVLGLGQMFVSMKQTSVLRQKLSTVQSDERTAMMFLENSIKGAGYNPNPAIIASAVTVIFPATGPFLAGQAIYGTGTGQAGADTLSVRYAASTNATGQQGCTAALIPDHVYTDVFSVANGYLNCTETDNTAGTPSTSVDLIGGLVGMNTLYGVDTLTTTPQDQNSVTAYLYPNLVGTYWNLQNEVNFAYAIKSVTITLIFANPLAGQPGQNATTVSLSETMLYTVGF